MDSPYLTRKRLGVKYLYLLSGDSLLLDLLKVNDVFLQSLFMALEIIHSSTHLRFGVLVAAEIAAS